MIVVATTTDGTNYLIYDVPMKLTTVLNSQFFKELINKRNVINNVIIFTRNKDFVQVLSTKIEFEKNQFSN